MCGIVLLKCLRPEERGKQGKILNVCVRGALPNFAVTAGGMKRTRTA